MTKRKILPKFMVIRPNKTTIRYYWQPTATMKRLGWEMARLSDRLSTAINEATGLNENWDAARQGNDKIIPNGHRPTSPAQSLSSMLTGWMGSDHFNGLARNTKCTYRQHAKTLKQWAQDIPLKEINKARVQKLYQHLKKNTPTAAIRVITAGGAAWNWAVLQGWPGIECDKDLNPFKEQNMTTPKTKARLWTDGEVTAMIKLADTIPTGDGLTMPSIGTAIMLMHWLGQYPIDILSLTWGDYKDGFFNFSRIKTNIDVVDVEASDDLKNRLDSILESQRKSNLYHTHICISEKTGGPWKGDNMRKQFRRIRAAASTSHPEMADLQMNHLRHTLVTDLFLKGATEAEIAAITGHAQKDVGTILDLYNIRTAALAAQGIKKRMGE